MPNETDGNELVNGRLGFQPLGNEYDGTTCVGQYTDGGLTKRELFAAMLMQGLLSNSYQSKTVAGDANVDRLKLAYATSAVAMADALIAELNKERVEDESNG